MTTTDRAATPADDFPLVFASAFEHPGRDLRATLQRRLMDLVEEYGPRYSAHEVRTYLEQVRGTVLEPFVLTGPDREMAVTLVRLAFSDRARQTRVRIVSRETMGTKGGLVLTNNLHSYYVERFVLGKYRYSPAGAWFIAPAALPIAARVYARPARHGQATMTLEKTRTGRGVLRLRMPWFESLYNPAARAREFQQNSRVQGMSASFDKLGLRIDVVAGGLEIRTGSTEALMRMLGLGSRGAILELDPGGPAGPRARAFVKLGRPEDGPIQLPTVMTATSRYPYPWLDIHLPIGLATSRTERLAIADWLPIHDSWVGDLLDTLLPPAAS